MRHFIFVLLCLPVSAYGQDTLKNETSHLYSAYSVSTSSCKTLEAEYKALGGLQRTYEVFPGADSIAIELASIYNSLDLFDSTVHLLQSRIDSGCCLPLVYQLYLKALMCKQNEDLAMTSLGKALVTCDDIMPLKSCFIELLTSLANHKDTKKFDAWYGLAYAFWPADSAFRDQIKRIRCNLKERKTIYFFKRLFG